MTGSNSSRLFKAALGHLRNFLLVSVPALMLCFIAAECVFRWAIPASEQPEPIYDSSAGLWHYDPKGPRDGIMTFGRFAQNRALWHINNAGWNSAIDYVAAHREGVPRVAIIGDSYVEAFQVDVNKNFSALARTRLQGRYEVYSFGLAGAALSDYLAMSRYARARYQPDIIVINVVHNDFDESLRELFPKPGCHQVTAEGDSFEEIPAQPYVHKRWRRFIRRIVFHSAFVRYLYWNLQVSRLRDKLAQPVPAANFNANTAPNRLEAGRPLIERAVRFLVGRFRSENPGKRLIFMMDALRGDIYVGDLEKSNLLWMNRLMRQVCDETGCEFIDLNPVFQAHWKMHGERFNWTFDGHWNALGHELAAKALCDAIVAGQPGESAVRK